MGKVFKAIVIGALVAVGLGLLLPALGVAFAPFTGLFGITSATLAAAVGGGILGGLSALLAPSLDLTDALDRLRVTIDPDANMKWVFGETSLATDIIWAARHGDSDQFYSYIIAGAGHLIDSFGALYVNDELVSFTGDAATGSWAGALWRQTNLGTEVQTAFIDIDAEDDFSPGLWSVDADGLGMAHYRLRWTVGHEKISSGVPTRVTQIVKGGPVYDPRLDTTRGGSGTHRADDQTTWEYNDGTDDIGTNWALIVLRYLLGWQINSKLVIGMGIDPDDIDMDQVMAAANACEALIDGKPRYRIGGILPVTNDHPNIIRQLEGAINGKVAIVGGKYYIWAPNDDLTPFSTIDEADLLREAGVIFTPSGPMEKLYNTGRGSYISNAATDLFNLVPYPEVEEATAVTEDGGVRVLNHDLSMVQDVSIAERVVRGMVRRSRFGASWRFAMGPKGLTFQPFTVTTLNCQETNNTNVTVRIIDMTYSVSGAVVVEVIEEDSSIYDTTAPLGTPVTQLDPGGFDPNTKIAITGLAAADITITGSESTASIGFSITWNDPGAWVQTTQVQYRTDAFPVWNSVPQIRVDLAEAIASPLEPNTLYDIRARHITRFGVVGDWVSIQRTSIFGPVGLPTSLTAASSVLGVRLSWTNPAAATFKYIEVWGSDDNVRGNAVLIGRTQQDFFIEFLEEHEFRTRFYWIRGVNEEGDISAWEPDTSTTTATAEPLRTNPNWIVDPQFDLSPGDPVNDLWDEDIAQGTAPPRTGDIVYQATGGEDGGGAFDLIHSGGTGTAFTTLETAKRVRFKGKGAWVTKIKYKTIGSADANDHEQVRLEVGVVDTETGGTITWHGGRAFTLPRSATYVTAEIINDMETLSAPTHNFVMFGLRWGQIVLADPGTADTLRVDSFQILFLGEPFGEIQAANPAILPGLVPLAEAADSAKFLRGDGLWAVPTGGAASDSFVTHTVTDTDSGFSWAATGSAVAESDTDTLNWVSGVGIDIDVDATLDAIRVSLAAQLSDLSDVNTSTPTNRNVLIADGVDWESRQFVAADVQFAVTDRFLARDTAGAGDGEEITGTQATVLLDAFTSGLKGLAPASGGGTTNYMRADGTWAVPPGTGPTTLGALTDVDLTGAADNDLLYRSGGNWIDTAGNLTWTGSVFEAAGIIRASGGNALQASNGSDTISIAHDGTQGLINTNAVVGGELWINAQTGDLDVAIASGSGFKVMNSLNLDWVLFSHDGTDFNAVGTNTLDWNISGITAIQAGTVDADFDAITATSYGGILEANLLSRIASETISGQWTHSGRLITDDSTTTRAGFNIPTGVAPTAPAQGDIWATATDAFMRINGVSESIIGAGASTLGALTDVDLTGAANNDLLYRSGGNWIDTAGNLTWDGSVFEAAGIVRASGGNALQASNGSDVLALAHDGTRGLINTNTTFGGELWINAQTGSQDVAISSGSGFKVMNSANLDWVLMSHDGTDFNWVGTNTLDWNISGITAIQAGTVDADFDAITAASYGGIVEADLVDKGAIEAITGAWTFSGATVVPEATVTAHEAALTILETQITDGSLLARLAANETINGLWTHSGRLVTDDSTTTRAGFNIPTGVAPTAPVQGDIWVTATDALIRINGVSESIIGAGSTTLGGLTDVDLTGAVDNDLLYRAGGNWIDTAGNLTWTGSVFEATGIIRAGGGNALQATNGTDALALVHDGTRGLINTNAVFGGELWINAQTGGLDVAISSGSGFKVMNSLNLDWVLFSHDGTDFNIAGTNTADINITGITAIAAGTVDADFDALTATSYGGILEANLVDKSAAETIAGAWTVPEATVTAHEAALTILESQITDGSVLARLAANETISGVWTHSDTLITDASDATASGFRLPHGIAPTTPVNGDLWTTTSSIFAHISGVTKDLLSATAAAFNDLTDVVLTGAADNDLLYRSGGNWIDTAGNLTWDGSIFAAAGILRATGGSAVQASNGADVIQMSHDGTRGLLATNTTFGGELWINGQTGSADVAIASGSGFKVMNSANLDWVRFSHDGTDFNAVGTNTTDWNITGVGGQRLKLGEFNLAMLEKASPPALEAGYGQVWVKNDIPNTLWFTNDAGTDFQLGVVASVFGRTGAVVAAQADYDSFFLTPAEGNAAYLAIGGTAANSQLLDSIDSLSFLRSNAADQKTSGNLRFNDNIQLNFGNSDDVDMYFNGTDMFTDLISGADWRLRHITEDMITAIANAQISLYYNGVEELHTQDSNATDNITGAEVKHWDGSFYDVGMARMPKVNFTGATTVSDTHWHKRLVHNGTVGVSLNLTFNTEASQPQDVVLWVQAKNGPVVLVDGTMVLHLYDGTGNPVAGDITIARGGWATVVKDTDSLAHVTGVGLS